MNIEHRTSNVQHRIREQNRSSQSAADGHSFSALANRLFFHYLKFDVGRWTFDVHCRFFSSCLIALILCLFTAGCSKKPVSRIMETTAYCGCSKCCSWERGSWTYLKLDFWNRYVSAGKGKGRDYTGQTAHGTYPEEPEEGFFSVDSLQRPWMIPMRLVFFPWYFLPEDGTIAADTKYYPFGTRMYIPGWGWGVVEDRGGAIKGPTRIDLYFDSHADALQWGRRKIHVIIEKP